mmetsp:Transcript_42571/g.102970  ORF Transcript_42571/g.102970 Transcript_42571/m.102970 type:complete len:322 (-) Transcript_42571:149-1114(-)
MARGAAAKLRRRNRKQDDDRVSSDMFGDEANGQGEFEETGDIPLPPGMGGDKEKDSDDEASKEEDEVIIPKKKKKKSKKSKSAGDDDDYMKMPTAPKTKKSQIKSTPLILLILMTGSTLLPAFIFASDYIGGFMAKHHVMGQVGFRLGMGGVPRKRVLSFYEKHDPEKIENVPDILSKYYGDYPKMIKKLERKYQDYGYFMGWEEDESPMVLAMEQVQETYDTWIHSYWNVYAPQVLKTGARNIRYNLTFLQKKVFKAWKKHIWPTLEPIFGVPKGSEKQKRADAAEARRRRQATSGGGSGSGSGGAKTRRSAQFRDDVDD